MAKPWAKVEIDYINHDKFRAINANAICLWHEGKNYCDLRLTDGLIPEATAKHFRFYSKKTVLMLTTSCGPKPGTAETYAPLWERMEGFGFKMHDYLDYNDNRETVLERLAKHEEEKNRKAANLKAWRERQRSEADLKPDLKPDSAVSHMVSETAQVVLKPDKQKQLQHTTSERTLSQSARVIAEPDVSDRARNLLESYADWYTRWRHGARLRLLRNALEFQDACDLCRTWDDARLEKLAKIVLTTDEPFIANTDRSFKIFALKASWADDRLRQVENTVAV